MKHEMDMGLYRGLIVTIADVIYHCPSFLVKLSIGVLT